ncbi:hypothetical protein GCM10009677_36730 [Sphaerisporangium rubeum]
MLLGRSPQLFADGEAGYLSLDLFSVRDDPGVGHFASRKCSLARGGMHRTTGDHRGQDPSGERNGTVTPGTRAATYGYRKATF